MRLLAGAYRVISKRLGDSRSSGEAVVGAAGLATPSGRLRSSGTDVAEPDPDASYVAEAVAGRKAALRRRNVRFWKWHTSATPPAPAPPPPRPRDPRRLHAAAGFEAMEEVTDAASSVPPRS